MHSTRLEWMIQEMARDGIDPLHAADDPAILEYIEELEREWEAEHR